ncbi:MAG: hypothetical protein A2008_11810 [Candidatus Wallbacteria bacterium GWC2_49_35]|uniref:Flagellar assembly protein FliH/Type III secretion system HrpE domain-containing protein n=1 Tax=Candidatus Wallbacteria bacterium GWC2_49_35 TaxID=1817813 RepID=A0A1F7WZ04_9BACT|nr:MAG: hypothetical protein A2008_11810 [Candidatus Wallbacteria bacterium GWC2_49_35]HBC76622.1 hypothetical protein [Candidatus Wallbacteria bacterium]
MSSIVRNFNFDNRPIIIDSSKSLEKIETSNVLVKLQQDIDRMNEEIKSLHAQADVILKNARTNETNIKQSVDLYKKNELEKTRKICEEIKEDTRREAFDKGFAEGKAEAVERAKSIIEAIEQVLKEALHEKDEIIRKAEQQIVELAMAISKKITRCEVLLNRDVIYYSVNEAIAKIVDRDTINIYMNLKDISTFAKRKEDVLKSLPVDSKVKIIEDNNILPGGCIISTNMGNIDATISSQMLEVEKMLEEALRQEEEEEGEEPARQSY